MGKTRRGFLIGLLAAGLAMLLNFVFPGQQRAAAQDDSTPTPVATEEEPTLIPTTVPSIKLDVTAEVSRTGDVDGDGAADPGDTITYTVEVTNTGAETVGPLQIELQYDPLFVGGTTPQTEGAQFDAGQTSWVITLEPDQSATFSAEARLNRRFPPGRTQVQAAAVVRNLSGVEIARQAAAPVEVVGPNVRINDVTFEMITDVAGNGSIDPGDSVRFTILYSNQGGGISQDVAVVADYPENLTGALVSVPTEAQESDGSLTWLVGAVPPDGEVRSVQFTLRLADNFPSGVTTYDLTVLLRGATTTLDQRTVNVPITGPSLVLSQRAEFTVDVDADNLTDPGDTLRITLQVANIGTDPANNVSVQLTYDTNHLEIAAVGQEGVSDPAGGVIIWTLPTVEAGSTQELGIEARVRNLPPGLSNIQLTVSAVSDETNITQREILLPADTPPLTPTPGPTGTPSIQETRPAQGQGILSAYAIALLIGGFLLLSLLSIVYVASRVLPGTAEEREAVDTVEERADHRRMVRELMEGIILTAILFSVMILGLQNALDQDSVNSIIAGIVGYVAGRVASTR